MTADGCRKEKWIQKEIERRLLLESKHTPPWFAVTPKDDSVVDRALGTVTLAQQESKKVVMEETKHKNTQAFHGERNPPEVLDLPPATAKSPQGKLKFKSCTVNKDQVKERESATARTRRMPRTGTKHNALAWRISLNMVHPAASLQLK